MHFEFSQSFHAPAGAVAEAFTEPGLYLDLATLPKLGAPEVLDRTVDGNVVRLRVHYRFTGELSSAVRAVIDPARLTWVDVSEHDLEHQTVRFHLVPDHYGDRFKASGSYRFTTDPGRPDATLRVTEGDLTVKAPFVAGAVERAIVSGLGEHLDDEVTIVERWLASR